MTVGFAPWLTKAAAPLTRADYRSMATTTILQAIAAAEWDREWAESDEDEDRATFALQELRAVLQERR